MNGELNPFRKRFLGGFNQRDVISYITKLADERNAESSAKDKALSEVKSLTEDIKVLQRELEEVRQWTHERREQSMASLESAAEALSELESVINAVFEKIEATLERVNEDFRSSLKNIKDTSPSIEQFGKTLDELRAAFSVANASPVAGKSGQEFIDLTEKEL